MILIRHALLAVAAFAVTAPAYAEEIARLSRVTFLDDAKQERSVDGRVLVEAVDGGILLQGRDGRLWNVTPDRLRKRTDTDEDFAPYSHDELGRQLQQELGERFQIVKTKHYVICTSADRKYAQWCGAMFERLLGAFMTHWKDKPLKLQRPAYPLPALVFADAREFADFATRDANAETAAAQGYYSMRTNRMVLYDLTAGPDRRPAASVAELNRRLAAVPSNVTTVVHEATHQIAFNCGMHRRYADNPVWLTEGMAMYFETPDLRSRSGWRTVGKVNPARLAQFRDFFAKSRKSDSLGTLIASDDRFRNAGQAGGAYAESWALTYFLVRTKRKAYTEYLGRLASKPQLFWDKPEKRLVEFKTVFGDDLSKLDADFVRYMGRLGRR